MSTADRPTPAQEGSPEGTWLEGKDILPANLPTQPADLDRPVGPPRKRPRPWSLIVGLPLLIIVCLALGVFGGLRLGSMLSGGNGAMFSGGQGGIATANDINGDPLLSARVESEPALPQAPVRYLEAQAKLDGQTMWDQLSPSAQQQFSSQGGSAQAFTQALQQGPHPDVKQITFVGGSTMGDGREAAIFVVTADVNGTLRQVPYFFTVNTDGKIDEVH
jgi:hypothetical protein